MSGYTKLFSSLVTSTVWREPDHVRLVWITMLALADADGVVEASVPGLAHLANVSVDLTVEALSRLAAPDEWSRTAEHEGRRVETTEAGWRLLNHAKYRALSSRLERNEREAERKRASRAASASVRKRPQTAASRPQMSAYTEAEAEADQISTATASSRPITGARARASRAAAAAAGRVDDRPDEPPIDPPPEPDTPAWACVLRLFDEAWTGAHGHPLGLHGGGGNYQRGQRVHAWALSVSAPDPWRAVTESAARFVRDVDGAVRSPFAAWSAAPGRWYGKGPLTREQRASRRAELSRLCREARQKSDEARTRGDAEAEKRWDAKWRSLCVEAKALEESAA